MAKKISPSFSRLSRTQVAAVIIGRILFLSFMLLPFIEMFFVSVKSLAAVKSIPYRLVPDQWQWSNYAAIWQTVSMLGRYILNSFFLGISVTLLNLFLILGAAYGFSRFHFRSKNIYLILLLSFTMISGILLLIPLYRTFQFLGLLNTYWPMILVGCITLLPVNIWLLKSYIGQIPLELDEAAYVDGANIFQILSRVLLPMMYPSMIVLGTRTFIAAYAQQFAFAITFNRKPEFMPITQGLYAFFGRQDIIWNQLMAASIVASLPVMIIFFFMQKYIIQGMTGAVKE